MKLYNTLTRQKEELAPVTPGKIGMYACGPTVYNYFHIGNARPFIVFDTLRRYLEYRGYEVTFVQNFTDIDDKMINRANAEGITVKELADRFIKEYFIDADALGVRRATVHPRATEHMAEIISMIEKLIANGHAYAADNGDVYFAPSTMKDYGKLSGQPLEDLVAGARIEAGDVKRHPEDFALWKAKKEGEPFWPSPWGEGRPGWHIECSAMSTKYLGNTFDIHGGGMDLIFPHHENEIAQSECATGCKFVNYWLHNGYINIDNQKMSKSAGNFFTVRDIAKEYDLEAVRLFMLMAQYRSPVNFSRELIESAKAALERLKNAKGIMQDALANATDAPADEAFLKQLDAHKQCFIDAMDDDLNTADAISALFEMVRDTNTHFAQPVSKADAEAALRVFGELTDVLGVVRQEAAIPQDILDLAAQRQDARKQKDFKRADQLRDELKEKGYIIEDTPQGPKVKRA